MYPKRIKALMTCLTAVCFSKFTFAESPEWIRYPVISPDAKSIAFTYRGDIYTVNAKGGDAKRLTFHQEHDYQPIWNADGTKLAFASERHGNFDIFVMDANGGPATRLTYHSADEVPYAFTNNKQSGERVLFKGVRTDDKDHRQYPARYFPELYAVSSSGGRVDQIMTTPAESISVSKDGRHFLYQDINGQENHWRKHHTSAVTKDIWRFDTQTQQHEQLTRFNGEDRNPVYSNDNKTVYYLSEQSGTFNVHKFKLSSPEESEQLTSFKTHPVRFLSQAKGTLAFSQHGDLYTMRDGRKPKKVEVAIRTQGTTNAETYSNINGDIDEFSLSSDGKQIAFIANGDVFVSSKDGAFTKQITDTPETETSVSFTSDDSALIYASERDRKWRVFRASKSRKQEPFFYAATLIEETALIDNDADNYQPSVSPDGKKIAFIENRRTLKVANIDGSDAITLVQRDDMIHFRDEDQYFKWSLDSQYLLVTYSRLLNNADIALVKADGSEPLKPLLQSAYYDYDGKWIMDGDAILWFSNKNGLRSYATSGRTQVDAYAMFLEQEQWDKFRLSEDDFKLYQAIEEANKPEESDEQSEDDESNGEAAKSEDEDTAPEVKIQWQGLEDRVAKLTIHSSFIEDAILDKKSEHLYYLTRFEGDLDLWKTNLRTQDTKKAISLGADWGQLSWDNEKETLYLLSDGKLSTLDLKKDKSKSIKIRADIKKTSPELFTAAFDHVWLRTSKAFYDPDFHGIDWNNMYDSYRPKVAHIDNAQEFAELLSEMIGELNVSHAGSGATRTPENADETARLGIFFDYAYRGNGIKITEVLAGGPLDKADLNVLAGDVITHIDGTLIDHTIDWAKWLNRKSDKFVLLTLQRNGECRDITVKPISLRAEGRLLYKRFVDINEQDVLAQSDNQLGYVHIPGMGDGPYRNVFDRMLGKHYDKKAMIVDTRFNGGGDLVADLAMFFTGESFISYETKDKVLGREPTSRYTKPIVSLFNESMYSDGHCYASGFKDLKLGTSVGMPVPGTCSFAGWERLPVGVYWGMVPVSAKNKQGEWMENNQTSPDVLIKNTAEQIRQGKDQQLDKAIEVLLKGI